MLEKYKVVYTRWTETEIIEKKSRFIATVAPVEKRGDCTCFYRSNEEKILGCET